MLSLGVMEPLRWVPYRTVLTYKSHLLILPRFFFLLSPSQCTWLSPRRWLNLQEYQSKKLMQESGVAVQRFFVADTASEALEAAKRLSE